MPLHFRKLWLGVGWGLVIGVILLSLMPPPPFPEIDDSFLSFLFASPLPHSDKLEHLVAYFILMGWFAQIYHTPRHRLSYLIGFILLGILLEILQGLGGVRTADWTDGMANSLGVGLAWQATQNRLRYLLVHLESFILRKSTIN